MQKALLVDDSKSARIIISRLLQKHGLEVVTAESGEEALELLKENVPDLIFMDYMMPGMSGIETMHKVHAQASTAHVPVVICTGNEGDSYYAEAMAEGASSMLSKPPSAEGIEKAMADITRVIEERASASQISQTAEDEVEPVSDEVVELVAEPDEVIELVAEPDEAVASFAEADESEPLSAANVAIQQAVEAATAELRKEFDQKLEDLRTQLANTPAQGGSDHADAKATEARFQRLHQEIEAGKKAVFEAVLHRMQQQHAKLFETIKEILTKQRADTIAMIKKAMGRG